jgi:hypothetical protein
MTAFPALMYRIPGPHRGPFGTTYDFCSIETQEQADILFKSGWSYLLIDEVNKYLSINKIDSKEEKESISRLQLEKTARNFGIKFDKKISDEKLISLIKDIGSNV